MAKINLSAQITGAGYLDQVNAFKAYAKDALGVDFAGGNGGIRLCTVNHLPAEGYQIAVAENGVTVSASSGKGMHNALADLLGKLEYADGKLTVEEGLFTEIPSSSYRGLMVDLARQKHPVEYILRYIDLCWKNRATHLQLHFTDDQSFTLPLTCLPKLATEGRAYTREEIALINDYAAKRGITLVPEVDIPGHTSQFFAKYPEIFGTTGVLPACEEVFDALRTIFAEVMEMFPNSPWIHIGGDEAAVGNWAKCERTQAYMKAHNIADLEELYAEYIRIATDMILDLGCTPVVWEGFAKEYNDRISREVIVIAWESYYQPAYDLAAAGFTLINCAWKPLYIVTPDTHWTPDEIMGWYPHNWQHWWDKSVAYPDGYTIDESYPVLGGQLCAWGDRLAGYTDIIKGCDEELALIAERLPALCKRCWEKN